MSGLRARCHHRSTTGAQRSSGGRTRTCIVRLTAARPADWTTPEWTEGEGVEPPRARAPPAFEAGYRADGSPSASGPGRSRTHTVPIKSRQLSTELRSRECGRQESNLHAPRFKRALYRLELRPRGRARLESNQRPLVCKTSALHLLSYSPAFSRRSWSRTSDHFRIREALSTELPACMQQLRDKDSNLGLHVQSVASCRLDDPGTVTRVVAAMARDRKQAERNHHGRAQARPDFVRREPRPPRSERGVLPARRSRNVSYCKQVFQATRTTLRPWIVPHAHAARPTWRSLGAGRMRSAAQRSLSLSGGASIQIFRFFKLSITSSFFVVFASETTKATLLCRPRKGASVTLEVLATAPPIEGGDVLEPAQPGESVHARVARSDGGR
jgi:hypothetical protein